MDSEERCLECVSVAEKGEMTGLRKGEWTNEEDLKLIDCVSVHGPAQWSYLAHSAGLKRSGKSCRLRWLNYLRPGVKHGNFTLQEQILILELHSRWGNRWSKIAQGLPGRTDNEIKNYWRTRVARLANQLNCDVNSAQFRDTLQYIWLPRLREQVQVAAGSAQPSIVQPTNTDHHTACNNTTTGYGLLDSSCTESETPDEANLVSPASDLISAYNGDHHQGDVLVSSSNWWGSINEEDGPIHADSTVSMGCYSEEEEGYWCRIFEECDLWSGGGDSFEYSNNDLMHAGCTSTTNHDWPAYSTLHDLL